MKMKKLILMMAIAAAGAGGCEKRPEPLKIDNALTAEEIAAGRLTPEVMWKMSRAGGSSLSPDGKRLLYQQTDYNMAENRGVTTIRVEEMDSKAVTCLTDFTSNNLSPQWSADGQHIYFLSDRGGSMQVWRMNASGGDATQITGDGDGEGVPDVEGFGVSPDGKHIWWVQTVRTADRRSSDIYEDMDKSKARIYDDLMARRLRQDAFVRQPDVTSFAPEPEENTFEIVRTKRFPMKPMTHEEAILQMELLEHSFFAFKDEENDGAFAVVYKRNDGGYGLIEDVQ